jgi:dihydrofolate reductase/uncharacterized protein YndB with AHSA1/START domain
MTDDLRYERIIAAAPEEVFDALTSPDGQVALYGQDDPAWVVRSECDLRVGGVWRIDFGPSPAELYRHEHVFEVIERPRRLLLATTETRLNGATLEFETEFIFEARDARTLMALIQRGFPTDELRDEHGRGVPNAVDRLERHIRERGAAVPATRLYMSMSVDGFITGPDDGPGNGLGTDGHRLHDWLAESGEPHVTRPSGANGQIYDEFMATGAVVVGRRTFEIAGGWKGDHHGVPIFVLSRREPGRDAAAWPLVSYVSDVATAMARAKEAAGDRDVLVHGARTAQLALAAGVLDELELHQVPVLLGQGRRLFDHLGPEHTELQLVRIVDAPGVTHLRYRVLR